MRHISNYINTIFLAFKAEFHTISHNRGALLILIGAAVIYPVLYSIAYSPELLRDLPIAVIDQDNTSTSRQLIRMLDATQELALHNRVNTMNEAEQLFATNQVRGVILIEKDFEANIIKGKQGVISTYGDASYMLIYKQTLSGVSKAALTYGAGIEIRRLMAQGNSMPQALNQAQNVKIQFRELYNPSGAYATYVMPALIVIILQQTLLIGIGLIGGYQREHGRHIHTIRGHSHFSSAIILGKALSYALVTFLNILFALVIVHHWFNFPLKNDYFIILLLFLPFAFSTIFLGISLSAMFKKAEHSIMVLVFLSLIIVFLSGFSWPSYALPKALQYLRLIFPSSIFLEPYLRIREMGVDLMAVKKELLMQMIQMGLYFVLALSIFWGKKRRALKTR